MPKSPSETETLDRDPSASEDSTAAPRAGVGDRADGRALDLIEQKLATQLGHLDALEATAAQRWQATLGRLDDLDARLDALEESGNHRHDTLTSKLQFESASARQRWDELSSRLDKVESALRATGRPASVPQNESDEALSNGRDEKLAELEQRMSALASRVEAHVANSIQRVESTDARMLSIEQTAEQRWAGLVGHRDAHAGLLEALSGRLDAVEVHSLQRYESVAAQIEALIGRVETVQDLLASSMQVQPTVSLTGLGGETSGPDLRGFLDQVEVNYRDLAAPFSDYERLIEALRRSPVFEVLPLFEFAAQEPRADRVQIGLRHDIDADPITAVRMARWLARFGVCGSFYLLHSAGYYGRYESQVLIRSPEIPRWVQAMIVAGCEIGVHNDALGIWQQHGANGAMTLQREISYLRALGANVRGTVGHNSAPTYGAENIEIFVGRKLWKRSEDNAAIESRLEVLDESRLGLDYEGTFAAPKPEVDVDAAEAFAADSSSSSVRSEAWMKSYLVCNPCLDWTVDVQAWCVGRDEWVLGGRTGQGDEIWEWAINQSDLLARLEALPGGTRCLMVLHPEYFRA